MKDFLDNDLAIGDEIVAIVTHGVNAGASLTKATIKRFTTTMVVITALSYRYGFSSPPDTTSEKRITPSKIVKIG